MRTTLRKIGNSRGVLLPAAVLAECGITDEIDLRLEGARTIIQAAKPSRQGWFDGYRAEDDVDAWQGLPPEADSGDWAW